MYCVKLQLDTQKVNVNGGAIALGHPLGTTACSTTICCVCGCSLVRLHWCASDGDAAAEMARRKVGTALSMCRYRHGAAAVFERGKRWFLSPRVRLCMCGVYV